MYNKFLIAYVRYGIGTQVRNCALNFLVKWLIVLGSSILIYFRQKQELSPCFLINPYLAPCFFNNSDPDPFSMTINDKKQFFLLFNTLIKKPHEEHGIVDLYCVWKFLTVIN